MTSGIASPRSSRNVQISIHDLPVELRRLRAGSVYWINVESPQLCLAFLRQILGHAGDGARGVLATVPEPSSILDTLALPPSNRDIRLFHIRRKPASCLKAFTRDLDSALRPRSRVILASLPRSHVEPFRGQLDELMERWSTWLEANGCSLLILHCDPEANRMIPALIASNDVLSGLASVSAAGPGRGMYQVEYWRTSDHVMGRHTFELSIGSDDIAVRAASALMHGPAPGERRRFLFEAAALQGSTVHLNGDWKIFPTRDELVQQAQAETTATVVFALDSLGSLPELATIFHSLRLQRGPLLKLVLREMAPPLRQIDAQKILDCGASVVVPAGTSVARMLDMLEEHHRVIYSRELVPDPTAVFGPASDNHPSGITGAAEFIAYVSDMVQASSGQVSGALVQLDPVPGLTAAQTLMELNLRRFDDTACALGDHLYVFLYGCHPRLVGTALKTLFRIPFDELFASHRELVTREEIEAGCERMRAELQEAGPGHDTDVVSGTTPIGNTADTLHNSNTMHQRYRPEPLSLRIRPPDQP